MEDIQGLAAMGRKAPKPQLMATYYAQLTRVFTVSGVHLYNGCARAPRLDSGLPDMRKLSPVALLRSCCGDDGCWPCAVQDMARSHAACVCHRLKLAAFCLFWAVFSTAWTGRARDAQGAAPRGFAHTQGRCHASMLVSVQV